MIPKSGNRFSDKIMLKQKTQTMIHSSGMDHGLGINLPGTRAARKRRLQRTSTLTLTRAQAVLPAFFPVSWPQNAKANWSGPR